METDIRAIVEKYLWEKDGINVTPYPENDVEVDGKKYHYVEVVYADRPAASLFVDVEKELLFNGFGELDISMPLDLKTLDDLKESGIKIIEEQSFQLPYNNKVRFISSFKNTDSIANVNFYLANRNGLVTYEFPIHYANEFGYIDEVVAVSFQDVDEDNKKDIIVICSVMSGVGKNGAIPFYVPDIYFQQEYGNYEIRRKISDELYTHIETKNISNIVEFMTKKY